MNSIFNILSASPFGAVVRNGPTLFLTCLTSLTLFGSVAHAQWTTQTINLRPGWNAVFLEVQPEPKDCDSIFADVPVETVWAWNRRFSTVQFVQDPDDLVPRQPDWLTYLPPSHPGRSAMNLYLLQGGRAYLIKLAANAVPLTWTVRGLPAVHPIDWLSDSYNFVGFHVDASAPPTFQQFFAASPAHAGKPIYRLNALGNWEKVLNPATTSMQRGEAYWVRCDGPSSFAGPLTLGLEQRDGLHYERILMEQTLRIQNTSLSGKTITLRTLASDTPPPSGSSPALAGPVPLSYYRQNLTNNERGWVELPQQLTQMRLEPGADWTLRLAVRRADMPPPPTGVVNPLYQSLLEVSDTAGSTYLVPITAQSFEAASGQSTRYAGLWVGSAVIRQVNYANNQAATNPVPTGSEFQFRLLVHVDGQGQAKLLQKVIQLWQNGTYTNDPNGVLVVQTPGRYVLLTNDSALAQYSGSALRDGQPVGRRISSAAFGFPAPINMTGTFASTSAPPLRCTVPLGFDDPLNPFKHRYHPDHDNLDPEFSALRTVTETNRPSLYANDGLESFNVTRDISLQFSANDPDGLTLPGWGDNQVGGTYREAIAGLHRYTIHLKGTFRLHRASSIAALNQ